MNRLARPGWVLRILLVAGVLLLAYRVVTEKWSELTAYRYELVLSPLPLLGAVLLAAAVYPLQISIWRRFMVHFGSSVSFPDAAHVWLLANLGKYVPGKLWTVAGAGVLAHRANLGSGSAVVSVFVLQFLAVATAFLLAAPFPFPETSVPIAGPVRLGAVVIGVITIGLVAGSRIGGGLRLRRLLPDRLALPPSIPLRLLALGTTVNAIVWLLYGLSLWLLARGVLPDPGLPLSTAVSAFAIAYVVGFLALFAPGGIGPRETILLTILAETSGAGPAAVIVVSSRLLLTVLELVLAIPFFFRRLSPGGGPAREGRASDGISPGERDSGSPRPPPGERRSRGT
jgi:hypothetical protein